MPISEVFNIDCLWFLKDKPDKFWDLAIVDPPYGIKENGNRDLVPKGAATARRKYNASLWDCGKPTQAYWDELFRVSKNQIVWGGNYFSEFLPSSRCWIVWDKRGTCPGNDFADCEMAWTSFSTSIRKFTWLWNGMLQQNMGNKQDRIHPTEKPFQLYEYCIRNYTKAHDKILDTHLGSQSSRIAAYKLGFDFWGTEIDPDYFKEGCERFEKAIAQPLFDNLPPETYTQPKLL